MISKRFLPLVFSVGLLASTLNAETGDYREYWLNIDLPGIEVLPGHDGWTYEDRMYGYGPSLLDVNGDIWIYDGAIEEFSNMGPFNLSGLIVGEGFGQEQYDLWESQGFPPGGPSTAPTFSLGIDIVAIVTAFVVGLVAKLQPIIPVAVAFIVLRAGYAWVQRGVEAKEQRKLATEAVGRLAGEGGSSKRFEKASDRIINAAKRGRLYRDESGGVAVSRRRSNSY